MIRVGGKICLLLATLSTLATAMPGWGVWIREKDADAVSILKLPAVPNFLLIRSGTFDKKGNVKFAVDHQRVLAFCQKNVEVHAWVSYRIPLRTTLNRSGGQALGANLNQLLEQSCFASVELDIEIINTPSPGMLEFLEETRRVMRPDRKLYFAMSPVGPPEPKGNSWSEEDMKKILGVVDGIDFMIYDTGLERAPYEQLLRRAIDLAKSNPSKSFRLGLPAYYDKRPTTHPLNVENTAVTTDVLRAALKDTTETLCSNNLRILYYAFWTMKREDYENARALDGFFQENCASRVKGKRVTPLR